MREGERGGKETGMNTRKKYGTYTVMQTRFMIAMLSFFY